MVIFFEKKTLDRINKVPLKWIYINVIVHADLLII